MVMGRPIWGIRATHIPTGETVTLESNTTYERSLSAATEAAKRLIAARLRAPIEPAREYVYDLDEQYPDELMPLRKALAGEEIE